MKNIQVSVINEAHSCPGGMMMFKPSYEGVN